MTALRKGAEARNGMASIAEKSHLSRESPTSRDASHADIPTQSASRGQSSCPTFAHHPHSFQLRQLAGQGRVGGVVLQGLQHRLMGGGELAVSNQDAKGEKAAEEFFEVRLTLKPDPASGVVLAHGMRGVLRLELPPSSLYERINEALRQLVQKRYRLG